MAAGSVVTGTPELVGADPPLVGLDRVGIGADREIDERQRRRLAPLAAELLEEQEGRDEDEDALVGPGLGDPERDERLARPAGHDELRPLVVGERGDDIGDGRAPGTGGARGRRGRGPPRPCPPQAPRPSRWGSRGGRRAGPSRCSGVISVARRAFAVRSAAFVTIRRRANRSGRKPRAVETSSQRRCERGSRRNLTWTPTSSPSSSSATRSMPRSVARMPAVRRPGQSSHVQTRRMPRVGSWRRKWATTRSKASPRARSSVSLAMADSTARKSPALVRTLRV